MNSPICHKAYLTKDTEVFTNEGWCNYEEIQPNDVILGININGLLVLSNVLDKEIRYAKEHTELSINTEHFRQTLVEGAAVLLFRNINDKKETVTVCTATPSWYDLNIEQDPSAHSLCNYFSNQYDKGWVDSDTQQVKALNPRGLAEYIQTNYVLPEVYLHDKDEMILFHEASQCRCIVPSIYIKAPLEKTDYFFQVLLNLEGQWREKEFKKTLYMLNLELIQTIQQMGILSSISITYSKTNIRVPGTRNVYLYEVFFCNDTEQVKSITKEHKQNLIWNIATTTKYIICRQGSKVFMINNSPIRIYKELNKVSKDSTTHLKGDTLFKVEVEGAVSTMTIKEMFYYKRTRPKKELFVVADGSKILIEDIDEKEYSKVLTLEGTFFSISVGNGSVLPAQNFNDSGDRTLYFSTTEIDISSKLKKTKDGKIEFEPVHLIRRIEHPERCYTLIVTNKDERQLRLENGLVILAK